MIKHISNIDPSSQKILYSVRDVSLMCDVSEAAVRMHITRRTGFLPEPIKTGTKRLYWTYEQLTAHFRSLTPPPSPPPASKKTGRPTKRESLAKAARRTHETPTGRGELSDLIEDGRTGSPAKQRDELQDGMDEWSYVSGWIDGDATRTATP